MNGIDFWCWIFRSERERTKTKACYKPQTDLELDAHFSTACTQIHHLKMARQWLKIRFLSYFRALSVIALRLLALITAFYASLQSRKCHRVRQKCSDRIFFLHCWLNIILHDNGKWLMWTAFKYNPQKQIICAWMESISYFHSHDFESFYRKRAPQLWIWKLMLLLMLMLIVDLYLHHNRISTYFLS